MKTCPYCMWEIPEKARKCKFCWEWVTEEENLNDNRKEIDDIENNNSQKKSFHEVDPRYKVETPYKKTETYRKIESAKKVEGKKNENRNIPWLIVFIFFVVMIIAWVIIWYSFG